MNPIKKKIIKVAEKEFAQKGYAGTRMDEIARIAKVNKATIYYQIGNKEALYTELLNYLVLPMIEELKARISVKDTAKEKMQTYIESFSELCMKNNILTHFIRVLLDSKIIKIKSLPFPQIIKILAGILIQGEEEGTFRKVPIFMVHLQILGVLGFYNLSSPAREQLIQLYPFIKDEGGELNHASLIQEVSKQVFLYISK